MRTQNNNRVIRLSILLHTFVMPGTYHWYVPAITRVSLSLLFTPFGKCYKRGKTKLYQNIP